MGHTRLGPIPTSRKWLDVVERVTAGGLTGTSAIGVNGEVPASLTEDVKAVAAAAIEAAEAALAAAIDDAGLRHTFYLLTQVVAATRSDEWREQLAEVGILLPAGATLFDLSAGLQDVVDDFLDASCRHSDISEMAQRAAGEALAALAGNRTLPLFASASDEDLQQAIRTMSTKEGFSRLGQVFFGRFIAHFLNFHLSRITAAGAGQGRVGGIEDITKFNAALSLHCEESALIVRKFSGSWYSKANFEGGITQQKTAGFVAHAVNKLRSELKRQGGTP